MRLLKAAVLSLNLLPAHAYAANVSSFISPAKITDEQKLCKGKQTNSSNQVPHFSKMVRKVAWYQDRDNSMVDIDINEDSIDGKVGRAMATFHSHSGEISQGIQVCPGVYLTTAHGLLDTHGAAIKQNRAYIEPHQNIKVASPYSFSTNTNLSVFSKKQFFAPRIREPNNSIMRIDRSTDYLFIKFDTILKNDFVVPLRNTPQLLSKLSKKIDINLYRGKSLFKLDDKNKSIFFKEYAIKEPSELSKFFNNPKKVKIPCSIIPHQKKGLSMSNCPTEKNVSGSSYVATINNKTYLTGLHISGKSKNIDAFSKGKNNDDWKGYNPGSTLLNFSRIFCQDYLLACGRPCVTLDEALKEE
jgi:hypothetical protein